MKKTKKHQFKYRDPEKLAASVPKKEKNTLKKVTDSPLTAHIAKDLKNTAITITIFIVLLLVFYFIQIKTDLLKPFLKLFNL